MSSPMSSLKKTKKVPLVPAHKIESQNVPYRHGGDALLEEVTSRMVNKRTTPTGFISEPLARAPTDVDLMQSMITRIASLEKHVQIQAKEILDKEKRISVLDEKCRLYQRVSAEEANSSSTYTRDLEAKCLSLQNQISDMEEFLLDYGMIWVGNNNETDDDNTIPLDKFGGTWNPDSSLPQAPCLENPHSINFDKIIENINELNSIAGAGEAKIEKTSSGARFKVPEAVQLTLYQNGILMFEGPFRSYDEETTKICIADLIDGYFPSELQHKYPDGVPFKVTDKRNVVFAKSMNLPFSGSGQSLGGETQLSRLLPSGTDSAQEVETSTPGHKMSIEQFLSQMPSSVIKGGKVIDIRSSVAATIKGADIENAQNSVTIVETSAMTEIKDRLNMDESVRPPSGRNITTLRIKDIDNHTYVLKMKFDDKIGDVIKYLDELRKAKKESYHLVTTFPSRVYDQAEESLFQAGLTPNATMHIRVKKHL